jgi:transposase
MQPSAAQSVGSILDAPPTLAQLLDVISELREQNTTQKDRIAALEHQLEWFRRQIFGQKSERHVPEPDPAQLPLGAVLAPAPEQPPSERREVAAHSRRVREEDAADSGEALRFFDESKVPVRTVVLMPDTVKGLSEDQYEQIGCKITYRLAQRPGAYEVLCYKRPVVKLKEQIHTVPAPAGVLENSRADVSFLAGILVDKFAWHLPLHRQHQRLEAAGLCVSRPWLTQLSQQSISLLQPIFDAQFDSIRAGRVWAMDETPIKAGRSGHGKMHTGYFWPVYGEQDEVCFAFHPSRAAQFVSQALGLAPRPGTVLLTDGYEAYERYAKKTGVRHARCWSHCRRGFERALHSEPQRAAEALAQIRALYAVEDQIRERALRGGAKLQHRLAHAQPILEQFFCWVDQQLRRPELMPKEPFAKALGYARARQAGLSVFLADPDVPIDTNHLERALRPVPLGKKNWMFAWTELGAKHIGIIQSLIVTCRLHRIDPYTYLVDVLQRVGQHPNSRIEELTPRRWKELFASKPLRSDIDLFPRQ